MHFTRFSRYILNRMISQIVVVAAVGHTDSLCCSILEIKNNFRSFAKFNLSIRSDCIIKCKDCCNIRLGCCRALFACSEAKAVDRANFLIGQYKVYVSILQSNFV